MSMDTVFDWIRMERQYQDTKWGFQNHENAGWMLILVEEIGKAAKAIFAGDMVGATIELIHTMAVGVAWLECAAANAMLSQAVYVRLRNEQGALRAERAEGS